MHTETLPGKPGSLCIQRPCWQTYAELPPRTAWTLTQTLERQRSSICQPWAEVAVPSLPYLVLHTCLHAPGSLCPAPQSAQGVPRNSSFHNGGYCGRGPLNSAHSFHLFIVTRAKMQQRGRVRKAHEKAARCTS